MLSSKLFRNLLLPLAAIVILGLVIERELRSPLTSREVSSFQQLAPAFELNDQKSHSIRLKAYLGRTRIVIVFFDGELGADRDPVLRPLIDNYGALERAGVELFAISMATPFANRDAEKRLGKEIPFPLLTDIDLRNPAPAPTHRAWGLYDSATESPQTGMFLVDRRGYVNISDNGLPQKVPDPAAAIMKLAQGDWPQQ